MEDDSIEHLVTNPSFQNIGESVCLFFSYIDIDLDPNMSSDKTQYDKAREDDDFLTQYSSRHQKELISFLRRHKYPAVSEDDPLAQDPGTIVVTKTGIQTPFYPKEKAKSYALDLLEIVNRSGFVCPLSQVVALRANQLPPPVIKTGHQQKEFGFLTHPDGTLQDYIKQKYGADFIERKIKEAIKYSTEISKFEENIGSGLLFAGRKFGVEPYYSYAYKNLEGRSEVYATAESKYAFQKSGLQDDCMFGFVHVYIEADDQVYYVDCGLERGENFSETSKQETIIVPK